MKRSCGHSERPELAETSEWPATIKIGGSGGIRSGPVKPCTGRVPRAGYFSQGSLSGHVGNLLGLVSRGESLVEGL